MTNQQIKALQSIGKGIIESAKDSIGAPSGVIYAALMAHGASLNQFNSIMQTLVEHGLLMHDSDAHLYRATDKGLAWCNKVSG